MEKTGQSNEKRSGRVILLLVIALAAFSSAMKELNQVHELTLQTSKLFAEWSDVVAPSEKPASVVRVESCEDKTMPPPVPPVQFEMNEIVVPDPIPPVPPRIREVRPVKIKRSQPHGFGPDVRNIVLKTLNRSIHLRSAS